MTFSVGLRDGDLASLSTPLLAIALPSPAVMLPALESLDRGTGGALRRTLERRDFRGSRDETLDVTGGPTGPARILLVGLGTPSDLPGALRRGAAIAARRARDAGVAEIAWWFGAPDAAGVEASVVGLMAGAWTYRDLKSPLPADERRPELTALRVAAPDNEAHRRAVAAGEAIGIGQHLARRLAMMPGNLCTPDFLVETATDLGKRHGIAVSVIGRDAMEKEGMGAFLAVAQATPQDPKTIVLEYRGGKSGEKPVVLMGKGLCFDSGGVSIKPALGMEMMKFDMCGAAGVLGAIEAIARMRLPVNVVGIIGATTNMVSGTAIKPGDVVRSKGGKYIEIINTDAEGRLVLADLLGYVSRYNPAVVVDAATLTGACVIALGHGVSAVFSANDDLAGEILSAQGRAGEPGWRLPLWDDYKDLIKSDVADVKNTGGRAAGSITAALFLQEFAEEYPWAHLDIAGTAYSESDSAALQRGPTGVPVGTFVEFVRGRVR